MISEEMIRLSEGSSSIRAMFEEGKRLASIYGAENVYDFSLGNPSVEPPAKVKEAIINILNTEDPNFIHGYTNNSGYEDVRQSIADYTNKKFGTNFSYENIVMTNGAAAALNIIFRCILNPGDEIITFAPFFTEYRNYVSIFKSTLTVVPANTETFEVNFDEFEKLISSQQSFRSGIFRGNNQKNRRYNGEKAAGVRHGHISYFRRALQRACIRKRRSSLCFKIL